MMGQNDVCIDGYSLLERLSVGIRATVYQGLQDHPAREVAVKIYASVPQDSIGRTHIQQFFECVQAASQLSHPNLARVYASAELDGSPYVVMEYCSDTSLQNVLKQGTCPNFLQAAGWIAGAARALSQAHRTGLVHGALKPSNLLLSEGQIKVSDFGARIMRDALQLDVEADGRGLRYFPPEQLHGCGLDGRTDQATLATILFELLTGVAPHQSTDDRGHRTPMAPIRSAHLFNDNLPEGIDDFFARALHDDPEERFPNCLAVAQALEHLANQAPLTVLQQKLVVKAGSGEDLALPAAVGHRLGSPEWTTGEGAWFAPDQNTQATRDEERRSPSAGFADPPEDPLPAPSATPTPMVIIRPRLIDAPPPVFEGSLPSDRVARPDWQFSDAPRVERIQEATEEAKRIGAMTPRASAIPQSDAPSLLRPERADLPPPIPVEHPERPAYTLRQPKVQPPAKRGLLRILGLVLLTVVLAATAVELLLSPTDHTVSQMDSALSSNTKPSWTHPAETSLETVQLAGVDPN